MKAADEDREGEEHSQLVASFKQVTSSHSVSLKKKKNNTGDTYTNSIFKEL